ncbi:MAG: DNA polymerase III subunit delta' [Planctomycetota bacterium]
MWKVIGQAKATDVLKRSVTNGRLSHALLFVGPKHVGKMTLAINLAQLLNCVSENRPCGECHSCRRIASGNYSDVQTIKREDVKDTGESSQRKGIGIDQVREMQHSVNLKPYEGGVRVIIIDGAELMSEEAANALLKTLEEPPADTTFVLITVDEGLLLPTILSRCQKLELPALPVHTIRQALLEQWEIPPERADLLARLSHGAIGWAISAISDETIIEERFLNLAGFISLADSDISDRFEFAAELATLFGKNRALVRNRLELWLTWWRDLMLIKNGCLESITNADREDTLQHQSGRYTLSEISEMIKSIQATMQQLEQNANPRLALEVLMLNIPSEREISHA